MQIMKRLFPILTAAVVLFSLMVSPASASSALPDYTQDLLADCPDGFKLTDITNGTSFSRSTAQAYVEGSRSYSYSWVPSYSMKLSRIVINVLSSGWPNSLDLSADFGKQSATRVGAYQVDEQGNYISQWVVDNPTNFFSGLTVTANWSWNYSGSFNLVSVTGYVDYVAHVSNVDWYSRAEFISSGSVHYNTIQSRSSASVPRIDSYVYDTLDNSDGKLFGGHYFITVHPDQREMNDIEQFYFKVTTFAQLDAPAITLLDHSNYDTPIAVISEEAIQARSQSIFLLSSANTQLFLIDTFVFVDLSGYDLTNVSIQFSFSQEPVYRSDVARGIEGFRVVLNDVGYTPKVSEPAWYVKVYQWISRKLDGLFGDSSGGALGQAGEQMSDQAVEMNAAQSQLDAVARPEVDVDDMLGGFLDFNTGGLSVLSVMTSNSYVTAMMTVVFTFALCGYIFFGKKG